MDDPARRHDATMRWYKAGSGQAMALLGHFGQERYGEPMYNDAATTARLLAP